MSKTVGQMEIIIPVRCNNTFQKQVETSRIHTTTKEKCMTLKKSC